MWYYLDKRGRPMEWVKGRPFSNFVRFLRYCRSVTTQRPDCMYPYWLCSDCGYVEDYDGLRDYGIICTKCNKASIARIEKRYKPLTEGTTKRASKEPTDRPRPDVEVPSQVAKPREPARDDEAARDKAGRIQGKVQLVQCHRAAMGWITEDSDSVKGDLDWSTAFEAVKQLRAELDRIKEGYANARNEISRRVPCTCLEQGDSLTGPHLWTCPLGILYRTFDELMAPGSSTPGAELPKFRNKTGKEKR